MDLLDRLLSQVNTLKVLWPSFAVVCALAVLIVWRVMDWRYRAVIESQDQRIKLRDDSIAYRIKQEAASRETAEPTKLAAITPPPLLDNADLPLKVPTVEEILREAVPFRYTQPEAERIFITQHSAPDLMQSLWGKTTVQERRIVQPYLGKWISISMEVKNVIQHDDETVVMFVVPETAAAFIWLHFPRDRERLEILEIGEQLTAVGRIEQLSGLTMRLYACELIAG